jgi:uncharacterized protein
MKLQPDRADTLSVTAHGPGWLAINGERFEHSLLITSDGQNIKWPCEHFSALLPAHFELLLGLSAEIILFGSGSKHQFLHPSLYQSLIAKGVGIECMDTVAASRTFNILAAEQRQVAAVLLITDLH